MPGGSESDRTVTRNAPRQVMPSAETPATFAAVHPPGVGLLVQVGRDAVVLGRRGTEAGGVDVPDRTVSRQHVRVAWDSGLRSHVVEDLGSHNGTWLNGHRLSERLALADGALVRLGDVLLVYERDAAGGSKDAPEVSREAIPGTSAAVRALRSAIARAAADRAPTLLVGETGTGKELCAREVHRLSGRRGPFIPVNCAELSRELIESQLFGHERGAFTGAAEARQGLFRAANGGTLFLDEIGELPTELQPKLLRVLQEGEVRPVGGARPSTVDVRVVAATNRDLARLVEMDAFRRDLYARLALWEIRVPPLRDRRRDILAWAQRLLEVWLRERGETAEAQALEAEAAEALVLDAWPENLRGLDRVVHRLGVQAGSGAPWTLREVAPLLSGGVVTAAPATEPPAREAKRPAPTSRDELEGVLARVGGSVRAAAKHYGRDRRQIYRWLEQFGLRAPEGDAVDE